MDNVKIVMDSQEVLGTGSYPHPPPPPPTYIRFLRDHEQLLQYSLPAQRCMSHDQSYISQFDTGISGCQIWPLTQNLYTSHLTGTICNAYYFVCQS